MKSSQIIAFGLVGIAPTWRRIGICKIFLNQWIFSGTMETIGGSNYMNAAARMPEPTI